MLVGLEQNQLLVTLLTLVTLYFALVADLRPAFIQHIVVDLEGLLSWRR